MADHKVSIAVWLLVFSLLGFQQVYCQQSNFRVFRTGAELREFEQFSARERLDFALLFPATEILEITGASQAATVQESVALNIDCLPWLRRFPGGSIRWYQTQLNEFGEIIGSMMEITPGGPPDQRIRAGGDFNRWLNISRIELVGGAEDPDSKIFECEVCIARGTPFEMCHTANYTNRVTGGPPVVNVTEINECRQREAAAPPGIEGGITEVLLCTVPDVVPRPVPPPTQTWFRNGVRAGSAGVGVDMEFLTDNPILMTGVFSGGTVPIPTFQILAAGELVFTTDFNNITDAMLGQLPPDITVQAAKLMLLDILVADWMCVANNTLGSSSVQNTFRICGDEPVIPDCTAASGSRVLFPDDGDVVVPGCDICIRRGTSVTLNCMVSAGAPPISYLWTVNGTEVSQNARLSVREPGNYSCSASNVDNAPVVETSVLSFSPRATLTTGIAGRNADGCERLIDITEEERAAIRAQHDTCIFVDETLEVACTSDDPMADLTLRGEDGTIYENGTAIIEVSMDNLNDANMTFLCAINNAPGACGGFVFRSSVRVFDPAEINRRIIIDMGLIGAGSSGDVVMPTVGAAVTLQCPTSGIPDETTEWRRVVEDSTGCFVEQPITDMTDGFTISQGMTGMFDDLVLTIETFNATFEGTYVCRTRNIAGADADVISLVTGSGSPEWQISSFSQCSMMCEDGFRNRSVTCRNNRDLLLIPEFMCQDNPTVAGPRPVSSLRCNDLFPMPCFLDPVWVPYPWSRCSQDCKGTRTRRVPCQVPRTGEIRPNYECSALRPRPSRSEVCPNTCCVSDVYPDICSVLGTGHCGTTIIQKLCCWTCGLTVIP